MGGDIIYHKYLKRGLYNRTVPILLPNTDQTSIMKTEAGTCGPGCILGVFEWGVHTEK